MFNAYIWGVIFTTIILDFFLVLGVHKNPDKHARYVLEAQLGVYFIALIWPLGVPWVLFLLLTREY